MRKDDEEASTSIQCSLRHLTFEDGVAVRREPESRSTRRERVIRVGRAEDSVQLICMYPIGTSLMTLIEREQHQGDCSRNDDESLSAASTKHS